MVPLFTLLERKNTKTHCEIYFLVLMVLFLIFLSVVYTKTGLAQDGFYNASHNVVFSGGEGG